MSEKFICGECGKGLPVDTVFQIQRFGMVCQDRDGNQYYTETKKLVCGDCQ